MSLSIKIADATFTKFIAQTPPYLELAKLFLLLGGDQASSVKNYAGTKLPATVVGTPTYSTGFASLASDAIGFESADVASGSPFTHILVATVLSSPAGYCGNWTGGANTRNLLNRNVNDLNLAIDGNLRVSTPMSGAGFHFIAGSHDGSTAKVYKGNAGVLTSASAAYSGGSATSKFRVGASAFSTGNFNAAAVMTFGSVLSEAQITEIYAYLTTLLATRGISVN